MHDRSLRRHRGLPAKIHVHVQGWPGAREARDHLGRRYSNQHDGHALGRPREAGGFHLRRQPACRNKGRPRQGVERRPQRVAAGVWRPPLRRPAARGAEGEAVVVGGRLQQRDQGPLRLRPGRARTLRDRSGGLGRHAAPVRAGARRPGEGVLGGRPAVPGSAEEAGGAAAHDLHGLPGAEGGQRPPLQPPRRRERLLRRLQPRRQGCTEARPPLQVLRPRGQPLDDHLPRGLAEGRGHERRADQGARGWRGAGGR
mmetsp:Transcript_58877/g.134667  ORF Transcript_58877/g.134667 Transcript_58877/m.134667 type:complete len:256 (-) Transcript_58877:244-1011(-)